MKIIINLWIVIVVFNTLLMVINGSNSGADYALIPHLRTSARQIALGNVLGFSDSADSVFENPAGLYRVNQFSTSLFSSKLMDEAHYFNVALSGQLPMGRVGFGYMTVKGYDIFPPAHGALGGYPQGVGLFDYKNSLYKFSFQRRLYKEQSVLGRIKKLQEALKKRRVAFINSKLERLETQKKVENAESSLKEVQLLLDYFRVTDDKKRIQTELARYRKEFKKLTQLKREASRNELKQIQVFKRAIQKVVLEEIKLKNSAEKAKKEAVLSINESITIDIALEIIKNNRLKLKEAEKLTQLKREAAQNELKQIQIFKRAVQNVVLKETKLKSIAKKAKKEAVLSISESIAIDIELEIIKDKVLKLKHTINILRRKVLKSKNKSEDSAVKKARKSVLKLKKESIQSTAYYTRLTEELAQVNRALFKEQKVLKAAKVAFKSFDASLMYAKERVQHSKMEAKIARNVVLRAEVELDYRVAYAAQSREAVTQWVNKGLDPLYGMELRVKALNSDLKSNVVERRILKKELELKPVIQRAVAAEVIFNLVKQVPVDLKRSLQRTAQLGGYVNVLSNKVRETQLNGDRVLVALELAEASLKKREEAPLIKNKVALEKIILAEQVLEKVRKKDKKLQDKVWRANRYFERVSTKMVVAKQGLKKRGKSQIKNKGVFENGLATIEGGLSYGHYDHSYTVVSGNSTVSKRSNDLDVGVIYNHPHYEASFLVRNSIPGALPSQYIVSLKRAFNRDLELYPQIKYSHDTILPSVGFKYSVISLPFISFMGSYTTFLTVTDDRKHDRKHTVSLGMGLEFMGTFVYYAYERSDYVLKDHRNYISITTNF